MKFGSKNNNDTASRKQEIKRPGLIQKIVDSFDNAIKDQYFYNTRNRILDYIDSRTNVRSAHVELFVRKTGGTYECRYDLYFTNPQGTVMKNEGFFIANISSAGYIPQYIINEVKQNGSAEIDFSTDDLKVLFNEKIIEIESEVSYDTLHKELVEQAYSKIVLIDRVYYTRVQCYDTIGQMTGIVHIANMTNIPDSIKNSLYPCKSCEVNL